MLSFLVQAGYPTMVVDLTNDLSSLLGGLVALTALSVGMIALAAVRYHLAQQAQPPMEAMPATIIYQQAA